MLAPARHGRVLFRSFRSLSSSSPLIRSVQLRAQNKSAQTCAKPSRCFSSFPRFQQQAATSYANDETPSELTTFAELAEHGLVNPKIIDTLVNKMKIHTMTDVQRMTINECLDGADMIAQAKTGTGKTLAFLMPIVHHLSKDPTITNTRQGERATAGDIRALIISPTRELAEQIAAEARKVVAGTGAVVQTAVGGTGKQYHLNLMRREGCHILVGTPGRVKDLLSDQYSGVSLDKIETFVLDEADRLLDIGFAPDIEEIQSYMPRREEKNRQTLMFSATVPKSVISLVRQTLRPDFKFVRTLDPDEAPTHESIPQNIVFLPGLENQMPAIVEIAMNAIEAHKRDPEHNLPFKAIIYFASLNEVALAYEVLQNLRDSAQPGHSRSMFAGHPLDPCAIVQMSSKLDQRQRTHNSDRFRRATSAIMCSSDVTARGMDFPNVSHVIQVGLPKTVDDYVHRVGRTGRAGKSGEGWLLVSDEHRREWQYKYARELKLKEDSALSTGQLDMTQAAQLPANVARIMHMIETSVKSVPFRLKAQAYQSMFSVLMQNQGIDKQTMVDLVNRLARYGWGMDKMPGLDPAFVTKNGLSRLQGLEVDDRRNRGDDDRGSFGGRGGRGSFGDRGGRGGFGGRDRDPFGFGDRGGRTSFGERGGRADFGERGGRADFGNKDRSFGRRNDPFSR